MRIEPSVPGANLESVRAVQAKAISSKDNGAITPAGDSDEFQPTVTLSRLLKDVREEPEVRADRVAEVAKKYESGQYDTPESAAETAAAILGK
jgi:hypothetical protein